MRIAVFLLVALVAACDDRIIELSPPPDGPAFDGALASGDGGGPDATGDGGSLGDGGAPAD